MAHTDSESFVRWQEVTRNHFSALSNLVLALATGVLAFNSSLLVDHKMPSEGSFLFSIASLVFLAASICFALWCSVNRLRDFRLTAQVARKHQRGEMNIQPLRGESSSMGNLTWRLFWLQVGLFGVGSICGALAVIIHVLPRLKCALPIGLVS